jgi:hypothetical protein
LDTLITDITGTITAVVGIITVVIVAATTTVVIDIMAVGKRERD